MKRILYIAAHRPGRSPGQRFRFEQYMPFLESRGFQITHSHIISEKDDAVFYRRGNYARKGAIIFKSLLTRLDDVLKAGRFDLIIVYREAIMLGSTVFERLLHRSGTPVVMDLDDAIWLYDVSEGNQSLGWMKRPSKTGKIMKMADMVFAGNRYLADFALQHNSRVEIVPTTIDLSYHMASPSPVASGKICIGWTGSSTTLKHFDAIVPVLSDLQKKFGDKLVFRVIADSPYHAPDLHLEFVPWSLQTEIEDLRKLDIGIMPLPDDEWSRGKCGFKGLQYMALGKATVMSPVGVNAEIIQDGVNGLLATSPEEWIGKLSLLIESAGLRRQLGENGRKTVEEKYSLQAMAPVYLQNLEKVVSQKSKV